MKHNYSFQQPKKEKKKRPKRERDRGRESERAEEKYFTYRECCLFIRLGW